MEAYNRPPCQLVEADASRFQERMTADKQQQEEQRKVRAARAAHQAAERKAREEAQAEARAKTSDATRKLQEEINATREEAAQRKMAKKDARAWDQEKPDDGWGRGRGSGGLRGGRGGGRGGRGRGGGDPREGSSSVPVATEDPTPTEADAAAQ
jgi:membrane protein involved in colicin uptake